MEQTFDFQLLTQQLQTLVSSPLAVLSDKSFWLQLLIIFAVFGVARWTGAVLLRRGLQRLTQITAKVPSFTRVWQALDDTATTLVWLMLQWLAIRVASRCGWLTGWRA